MRTITFRSAFKDREIELDSLAIVMLVMACGAAAAFAWLVATNISASSGAGAYAFAASFGLAVGLGWLFGYPRRAAAPAIGAVFLIAIAASPHVFDVDGLFLRDASGVPASRLLVIAGLYTGGLGVLTLAFGVFAFIAPLVGALRAWRRGMEGGASVVTLHVVLAAIGVCAVLVGRAALPPAT